MTKWLKREDGKMSNKEDIFEKERKLMSEIDKNNVKALDTVNAANQPQERIIGDLHFFGKDIIKTVPRKFNNIFDMNLFMIHNWNEVTAPNDIVFVDGDLIDGQYCTKKEAFELLDKLNGTIILIAGNHDIPFLDWYREYGITVIEYPIIKDGFWIISHEPQYVSEAAPYANIFAHVHLNPMYKDVSPRSFCVSAERIGYKPMLLSEVKNRIRNCKN